jgi:hypothetical protein
LSAAMLCCVFLVPGCDKLIEYLEENPDAAISYCNVKKFTENTAPQPPRTANFTYNFLGQPVKITVNNVGTGNPNRVFKYDGMHRLKEYRGEYLNNNYEYWYRYAYDGMNRVVADTQYTFGPIGPEPTTFFDRRVTQYSYDAYNRIIQTSTVSTVFPGPAIVVNYNYDAMGNLVRPGVVYDNKINVHRTNKVWMLIDKDYSLNNPLTAETYNANKLPLSITLDPEYPLLGFLWFYLNDSDIQYMCN